MFKDRPFAAIQFPRLSDAEIAERLSPLAFENPVVHHMLALAHHDGLNLDEAMIWMIQELCRQHTHLRQQVVKLLATQYPSYFLTAGGFPHERQGA